MAESAVNWMQWPGRKPENWTPWVGCSPCSPGCDNCWARRYEDVRGRHLRRCATATELEAMALAAKSNLPDPCSVFSDQSKPYFWRGPVYQGETVLKWPMHCRDPRLFWCCPSSDPFHEEIPDEQIDRMLAVVALCPQHEFLMLTKRAERMATWGRRWDGTACLLTSPSTLHTAGARTDMNDVLFDDGKVAAVSLPWPLQNLGLGVTVCTQAEADEKIPHLLATPAAWRFLSVEPMLGPVDLSPFFATYPPQRRLCPAESEACPNEACSCPRPDQVIIGCESGPGRRPCPLDQVRSVVEQCDEAGVPVWVKQLDLNGKVSHDTSEWPEWARRRELPAHAKGAER